MHFEHPSNHVALVWEGGDGSVRSWSYGALTKAMGRRIERGSTLTLETAAAVIRDTAPTGFEARVLCDRCGVGEHSRVAWMGPADHPLFAWLLTACMQLGATVVLHGGDRVWQVTARQSVQVLALPDAMDEAVPELADLRMIITAGRGSDAVHFNIAWRL